jgi:hypothetical protein
VTSTYRIIGKPIGRPDGGDKVTGAGRYSADHQVPGTIWGKSLHSPPHAELAQAGATFVTVSALGMLQLGVKQFRAGVRSALQ